MQSESKGAVATDVEKATRTPCTPVAAGAPSTSKRSKSPNAMRGRTGKTGPSRSRSPSSNSSELRIGDDPCQGIWDSFIGHANITVDGVEFDVSGWRPGDDGLKLACLCSTLGHPDVYQTCPVSLTMNPRWNEEFRVEYRKGDALEFQIALCNEQGPVKIVGKTILRGQELKVNYFDGNLDLSANVGGIVGVVGVIRLRVLVQLKGKAGAELDKCKVIEEDLLLASVEIKCNMAGLLKEKYSDPVQAFEIFDLERASRVSKDAFADAVSGQNLIWKGDELFEALAKGRGSLSLIDFQRIWGPTNSRHIASLKLRNFAVLLRQRFANSADAFRAFDADDNEKVNLAEFEAGLRSFHFIWSTDALFSALTNPVEEGERSLALEDIVDLWFLWRPYAKDLLFGFIAELRNHLKDDKSDMCRFFSADDMRSLRMCQQDFCDCVEPLNFKGDSHAVFFELGNGNEVEGQILDCLWDMHVAQGEEADLDSEMFSGSERSDGCISVPSIIIAGPVA